MFYDFGDILLNVNQITYIYKVCFKENPNDENSRIIVRYRVCFCYNETMATNEARFPNYITISEEQYINLKTVLNAARLVVN